MLQLPCSPAFRLKDHPLADTYPSIFIIRRYITRWTRKILSQIFTPFAQISSIDLVRYDPFTNKSTGILFVVELASDAGMVEILTRLV